MMLDGAEECQLSGPIGELVPYSFSTDGSFSTWLRLRGTRLLNHWITSRGSDHHRKVVPCCWPLPDRSHVLL
jgi:hypothetical protein